MIARQLCLNFEPGAEYQYSNSGYVLLSIVVNRVSGLTLDQFAQECIFSPLNMNSTFFQRHHGQGVPNFASGYNQVRGEWLMNNAMLDVIGCAGVYSTAGDLLKWAENFRSPTVGSQALVRMQTKAKLVNGNEIEYGMGLAMDTYRGLARVRHAGGSDGYRANFEYFPSEELAVVLLCNNTEVDFLNASLGVAEIFLGSRLEPSPQIDGQKTQYKAAVTFAIEADRLTEYSGEYWSSEFSCIYRFFVREGELWYEPGDEGPQRLSAVAEESFHNAYYNLDFAFFRDEHGGVGGFCQNSDSTRNVTFTRMQCKTGQHRNVTARPDTASGI